MNTPILALAEDDLNTLDELRHILKEYNSTGPTQKLTEAIQKLEEFLLIRVRAETEKSRFVLKSGGNIYIVQAKDILWVEASGNYVHIITEEKKYLHRATMSGMLKRLNPTRFFQIHRSTIVNLDFVDHIEECSYGDCKVIMKNNQELKMSRNFTKILQSG